MWDDLEAKRFQEHEKNSNSSHLSGDQERNTSSRIVIYHDFSRKKHGPGVDLEPFTAFTAAVAVEVVFQPSQRATLVEAPAT